jgi:hypothetical protein
MKRKRRKFLLPSEYLGPYPAHPVTAEKLREARPALFVIWAFSLSGCLWCGFAQGKWAHGVAGMAISAGAGYALWQTLVTGYASSKQGNFLRAEQPVRFWLTVAVLAFGYLVVLAVLFFGGHGTRS